MNLSFKDTRSLHQKIDKIPDKAGTWKRKVKGFQDRPEEKFTFYYRDSLEAVRTLLGDPTLAHNTVYAPKLLYAQDHPQNRRIFTEMWTGDWWWNLQAGAVTRKL